MSDAIDLEVIDQVIRAYKGVSNVQARFNYTKPMGVYNWRTRGIPKSLIADIHIDTAIPIETLKTAVRSAA